MRRFAGLVLLIALVAVITTVSAAPLDAEPVLTGAVSQLLPAVGEDWFAWTQTPRSGPEVRVRPIGASSEGKRLTGNGPTGFAFTGGFDEAGDLVYQRGSFGRGVSDIRVYDPDTGNTHEPPPGVNTPRWEWRPSWSQGYLLFGRNTFTKRSSPWNVVLYNRSNQRQLVLATAKNSCACIFPGNVTDSYATWTRCDPKCQVVIYDISSRSKDTVPGGGQHYYGSVTTTDDVYFINSGNGCGENLSVMRRPIGGGPPVIVNEIPNHFEILGDITAFTKADLHTDVYFDRFDCRRNAKADIYVIRDAETASILASDAGRGASNSRGGKRLWLGDAIPRG